MEKTFEEILREKMGQEVSVRGKDGVTMLPMEAMVMSLMNEAMKGSIPAIMFIRSLTEGKSEEVDAEAVKSEVEKVVSASGRYDGATSFSHDYDLPF